MLRTRVQPNYRPAPYSMPLRRRPKQSTSPARPNARDAAAGPRVVATLRFPGPEAIPEHPSVASAVRRETVRLLAEVFALEAQLAGTGTPVTAKLREDGFWDCGLDVVARHLNEYFGGEARYDAFPWLSSEPLTILAAAVASLFGAHVTWAHGSPDELPSGPA